MSFKTFTEAEIKNYYQKHVIKSDDYFNKCNPLPLHLNNKTWKWEGNDFPRIAALIDFQHWVKKHNINPINKILITGINDPELEFLQSNESVYLPYDGFNGDFHTLHLEDEFDFILFNQTIEHLYNPFLSMWNLYHHLKPGGFMYTSMPIINIPHMVPFHFNGFTPIGLGILMESVGFKTLELGYWGNKKYIDYIFQNHNWPDYRELIDSNGCITHEKDNEVQTWILVQK